MVALQSEDQCSYYRSSRTGTVFQSHVLMFFRWGQDVWRRVHEDPEGSAEGLRSGLGPAGRTLPEPGLPGPEGRLSAEQIPVPGPDVPRRTGFTGLQGTRTVHRQNPRGGVEETDGENHNTRTTPLELHL